MKNENSDYLSLTTYLKNDCRSQRKILERCEKTQQSSHYVQNATNWEQIRELKRLKGAKAYRIRIGDYRIGVTLDGETVEFITVGHRKEFYNFFP